MTRLALFHRGSDSPGTIGDIDQIDAAIHVPRKFALEQIYDQGPGGGRRNVPDADGTAGVDNDHRQIGAGKFQGHLLGTVFGDEIVVLGRIQIKPGRFIRRLFAVGSQGGHRTAINNFLNPGFAAGRQHIAGSLLVGPVHQAGIRQPAGIDCGQVIDTVAAFHGPVHRVDVTDISMGNLDIQAIQVFHAAGFPHQAANSGAFF